MAIAAVVLAAGESRRFGPDHKVLAPLDGRPLLAHVLAAVVDAEVFAAVYVVSGPVSLAQFCEAPIRELVNENWATGMGSSLLCALRQASSDGMDAVVVGLADQPGVTAETWRQLAEAAQSEIVVATYQGQRGNPVRLDASVWSLIDGTGDYGARELMRRRPELVTELACEGNGRDIDTLEDLEQWN